MTQTVYHNFDFYMRPDLASGYCRCLRLCVRHCVYHSPDCPQDNSSSVQTSIIKFGPEVHNNLVKAPVGWGESDPDFQGQIYLKIQFLSNTWDDCD